MFGVRQENGARCDGYGRGGLLLRNPLPEEGNSLSFRLLESTPDF
jgi:hypothetical protein